MAAHDRVPDLRLVRVEQVQFHEHPERKRTLRLVERIRSEKILRNPPIVAQTAADAFVLLDGANRASALREIGYTHVPVQVINYGDNAIELKGWHHLLLEGRNLGLRELYEKLSGVVVETIEHDALERYLELRRVYAVLVDETTACWGVFPADRTHIDLHRWMGVLDQIVAAYEGKTRLERIKLADYGNLPKVFETVDHQLVLFPKLTKIELLRLVTDKARIPTGLTRHLIPGRALGLNLDLSFLTTLASESEKIAHFRSFVDRLEIEGRIRFYEESAFIMNE